MKLPRPHFWKSRKTQIGVFHSGNFELRFREIAARSIYFRIAGYNKCFLVVCHKKQDREARIKEGQCLINRDIKTQ